MDFVTVRHKVTERGLQKRFEPLDGRNKTGKRKKSSVRKYLMQLPAGQENTLSIRPDLKWLPRIRGKAVRSGNVVFRT